MNYLDFEKPIQELERRIKETRRYAEEDNVDMSAAIADMEKTLQQQLQKIFSELTPWQRILLSRHPQRPYTLDYVGEICDEFIELHGDRHFADDRAIVGGLARIDGHRCVLIGHQKGRDVKERRERNFGMPHPEGYRKALRLMRLAERFRLPVVSLIDTQAAYPGVGAEERGQAEAIARNILEMSQLRTPILVAIIGEGGSGGALAIGVGDRILMQEYAIYVVCPPETCATILWRDRSRAPEAATAMRITAKDLLELGVIDEIIPEPLGGAHRDPKKAAELLKERLVTHLEELTGMTPEELIEQRYRKFRNMGRIIEKAGEEDPARENTSGSGEGQPASRRTEP